MLTAKAGNTGRPDKPVGLKPSDTIVTLLRCPDCQGRGYFLINPFATGGDNGAGGIRNMCQCQTCWRAHEHWQSHGVLPPDVFARMAARLIHRPHEARQTSARKLPHLIRSASWQRL